MGFFLLPPGLLCLGLLLIFVLRPERLFPDYALAEANLKLLLERGEGSMQRSPSRQFAGLSAAALEDERIFQRYLPIDFRAIARAIWHNLQAGRITEGGSTIAMQLAKAALPKEKRLKRNFRRKFLELRLALSPALFHKPAEDLLGAYIENMDCGIDGARGLDACALYLFARPAYELSAHEILFLTAAIRAPGRTLKHPPSALPRMQKALQKMQTLRWIQEEQAEALAAAGLPNIQRNPSLLRSLQEGRPLKEARLTQAAFLAAFEAAQKRLPGLEDDISVAVALYADGELLSFAGAHEYLLTHRVEPGSWMKVFCGKGIYDISGEDYLVHTQVPLDVPLWDRRGRPYRPGNVGKSLPERAPPILYLARSTNTGVLAAVAYLPVFLPPDRLRQALDQMQSPHRSERHLWQSTRHLHRVAEAYSGMALPEGALESDLGYGQTAAWARQLCYANLKRHVPEAHIRHDDWSTLLGAGVEAPLMAWAQGFTEIMYQDRQLTPFGAIMAEYGLEGTLAHHLSQLKRRAFPYKTHSTERSAGLLMTFQIPDDPRVFTLQVYAHRPSGKKLPKGSIYGSTVGGPAWKVIQNALF